MHLDDGPLRQQQDWLKNKYDVIESGSICRFELAWYQTFDYFFHLVYVFFIVFSD